MRSSVLSAFTIRNGGTVQFGSDQAGGVYVNNAAPIILNNVITANQWTAFWCTSELL